MSAILSMTRTIALALGLCAVSALAHADIYLCVDAAGRKELTDTQRPGCRVLALSNGIPAPSSARRISVAPRAAVPMVSPENFPKVDNSTQKARDADRRQILVEELQSEEGKLAELRRDYHGGEPERLPTEKTGNKYAERVGQMRDAIARSEKNIEALKRELSLIK